MRVAVLDLGTNTFNLIVAQKNGTGEVSILHTSKKPVKLGEGGINSQLILPSAFERGIKAIESHNETIRTLKAERIFAFGTSALRTASNGRLFIETIKRLTGIEVEIISGDREAELIYYGVRETLVMTDEKYLILDIGGGSNEFIIANRSQIFWKKSYPIGIARLLERFKPSDPITQIEIATIERYLDEQLSDLFETIKREKVKILLGASGSFETFMVMIGAEKNKIVTEDALRPESELITLSDFYSLYQKLIQSSFLEREKMKGLESLRIEMIVLACHFVKYILETAQIETLIQSNFSLKEGVIYQLFKN